MIATHTILMIFYFTVTNGKYQYEGLCYTFNDQTKIHALRYPQKVHHDPTLLEKFVWSQNENEKLECACPVEQRYVKSWLYNYPDTFNGILFRVDREDDNCKCRDQVKHSILPQGEYGTYKLHMIAFKIYYERDANVILGDHTVDIHEITFSMGIINIPILWVGINDDGNRFVWHFVSNLIEPRRQTVKLSKFTTAPFDEVTKSLDGFYEQENQLSVFKDLMDKDTVENIIKNNIYLVPQQLAREELVLLNNVKSATMYKFNVVPIWNNIADDWADIQNAIIEHSGEREPNIHPMRIVSGTFGIYQCKEKESSKPKSLHLKSSFLSQTINVPYYYWNLYFFKKAGKPRFLFVIMHNEYNPNKDNPQQEKLCKVEAKCEDYTTNLIKKKKGILVYCCAANTQNTEIFQKLGLQIQDFTDEKSIFSFESRHNKTVFVINDSDDEDSE